MSLLTERQPPRRPQIRKLPASRCCTASPNVTSRLTRYGERRLCHFEVVLVGSLFVLPSLLLAAQLRCKFRSLSTLSMMSLERSNTKEERLQAEQDALPDHEKRVYTVQELRYMGDRYVSPSRGRYN